MALRLAQINAGRSIEAMNELRRFLDCTDIQVLLIQEPYARFKPIWPGCRMYYGAKPNEDIWSLIIVKDRTLSVVLNAELSNQYCTVIELSPQGEEIEMILVNSYFRYNENIEPHIGALERILDNRQGRFTVISADINAKAFLWHNDIEDERGLKFESFLIAQDLQVCNVKSKV